MFKFNNKHIFTGYLKQKLSSVNIPTCKIYTREFSDYLAKHGTEDPRVVESTNTIVYNADSKQLATRINYLRGNELYNYYDDHGTKSGQKNGWRRANMLFYDSGKQTPGLTKTLHSPGGLYDQDTHEYLGEYLRFLRDYHDVDLMSLYNCFNNTLCNNINFTFPYHNRTVSFSSYDSKYRIYAFPVKLFADYTIAIDSYSGVEIFCGLYNTHLYNPHSSDRIRKDQLLGAKTYLKTGKISFGQPILFDKLNVKNWSYKDELKKVSDTDIRLDTSALTRWDILNREGDLKMFIKVPSSCRSSIVVLEGDYRGYNNARYLPYADDNISMYGCSEGKDVYITGGQSKLVKNYRLSDWTFGYIPDNVISEPGVETNVGWIVPTLTYVKTQKAEGAEDLPNIDIWEQDTYSAPEYSEELRCCLIKTAAELAYVILNNGKTTITDSHGNTTEVRNYRLTNDIYLNDPEKVDWESGEALDQDYRIRQWLKATEASSKEGFSGVIDGNGHVVFGLYSTNDSASRCYAGLIPVVDTDGRTVLKNLGINYAHIRGTYAQAFIGHATNSTVTYDRWKYEQNHSVVNFSCDKKSGIVTYHDAGCNRNFVNDKAGFKPISKLQLLEFNTGESYPFADRLVEYLCGSAITPMDEIADNIKRAQRVMKQNQHHFRVEGLWENKMQKIIYDYIMNSGPIELDTDNKLIDKRRGYHNKLGHTSRSTTYDILGYVDKDAEKWYASTKIQNDKPVVHNTIQNVDIYDGLYDI